MHQRKKLMEITDAQAAEGTVSIGLHRAGADAQIDAYAFMSPAAQQSVADLSLTHRHLRTDGSPNVPGRSPLQVLFRAGKQGGTKGVQPSKVPFAKVWLAVLTVEVDCPQLLASALHE